MCVSANVWIGNSRHVIILTLQYDHDGGRSIRSSLRPMGQSERPNAARASAEFPQQSPQQLLNDLGSDEKVREGNAKSHLLDFFGI